MSFFKKRYHAIPERYPENTKGDFYVQDGVCTSCGAPQAEAPDLIDHSKSHYGHCYFKKQPETDDEIEQAIQAIAVSCIAGLRYGGKEEKILRRLFEIGQSDQCDHKPIGNYKTILWDNVTFHYEGSIMDLSKSLTAQIVSENAFFIEKIINFRFIKDNCFEFIYRWADGYAGNIFRCYHTGGNRFRIEISVEKNGFEISMRGNAIALNTILCSDNKISDIVWFDKDNKTYLETELR